MSVNLAPGFMLSMILLKFWWSSLQWRHQIHMG